MSAVKLADLNPASVFGFFEEICAIPHGSRNTKAISDYLVDFAKTRGLRYFQDEVNNVVIFQDGTCGYENHEPVILQGHMDMVCEKDASCPLDMAVDGLDVTHDGAYVFAKGTTLGADNGIGAAAILAVLEDKTLVHGPVEALFTATEETGMDGAFGLKGGLLQGDILLNLDSETEGELYVGCAGGLDANITLPYTAEAAPAGYVAYAVEVKGLKGGHSGIQIGYQRANANRELFRLLNASACDIRLSSVDGGGLRNAIPREATAVVLVAESDVATFEAEVVAFEKTLIAEYANIEDSVSVKATVVATPAEVIPADVVTKLAKAVIGAPNGVVKMSVEMEGLVQTSSNLARVVSDGSCVKIQCLLRSSVNSEKHALGAAIKGVFELAGATVELSGDYDGWKPNMESPILHTMLASYESLYGKKPAVMAIHAGLECGIIGGKYEGLDMISFGPTICFPHSPDEKVEIASVGKFYSFLLHTLANAPLK